MFEDILVQIQKKQENKTKEISDLLVANPEFYQKLISSLKGFINQAKDNGIVGVEFS